MYRKSCLCMVMALLFFWSACERDSGEYNDQVVLGEIERLDLTVTGEAVVADIRLPYVLSGPDWGLKKEICEEGGYDLAYHAGQKLYLTSYSLEETCNGEPLEIKLLSDNSTCVCAYKTGLMVPGLFAVDALCANE